ncbi:hypothetical protein Bca4012_022994 [Brassica carinata]
MESNGDDRKTTTYCVTGANGDIGSWLVKFLLERGYIVHATLRDLVIIVKLKAASSDNLNIFKPSGEEMNGLYYSELIFKMMAALTAPLRAVTESSMELDISPNHVNFGMTFSFHSKVVDPAIKAVRNVLGSCLLSKSVKRVVFTSSISSLKAKDENERWRSIVDQICKTPIDHVLNKSKWMGK